MNAIKTKWTPPALRHMGFPKDRRLIFHLQSLCVVKTRRRIDRGKGLLSETTQKMERAWIHDDEAALESARIERDDIEEHLLADKARLKRQIDAPPFPNSDERSTLHRVMSETLAEARQPPVRGGGGIGR